MKKDIKNISNAFLFLMIAVSFYFAYLIFQPFLSVIVMAGVFASLFYPMYTWFRDSVLKSVGKGRESLASFLTVLIFVLIIVLPMVNFIVLLANESTATYATMSEKLMSGEYNLALGKVFTDIQAYARQHFDFIDWNLLDVRQIALDLGSNLNTFILAGASYFIRGTTQLFTNLFFLLLTMFFLFRDGEKFFQKIAYLTPLSNKYDQKLFNKFREVSRTTILSSLLTALAQALVASVAFAIVGLPVFFLGVATAIAALIPVIGTSLVSIPTIIVLLFMGRWGAALFLAIWSFGLVALMDNVIRAWFIKGQSQIHPLLVFFSIFGGVYAFGFPGIIFGPLILAIILTVLHIYELEYQQVLER